MWDMLIKTQRQVIKGWGRAGKGCAAVYDAIKLPPVSDNILTTAPINLTCSTKTSDSSSYKIDTTTVQFYVCVDADHFRCLLYPQNKSLNYLFFLIKKNWYRSLQNRQHVFGTVFKTMYPKLRTQRSLTQLLQWPYTHNKFITFHNIRLFILVRKGFLFLTKA